MNPILGLNDESLIYANSVDHKPTVRVCEKRTMIVQCELIHRNVINTPTYNTVYLINSVNFSVNVLKVIIMTVFTIKL